MLGKSFDIFVLVLTMQSLGQVTNANVNNQNYTTTYMYFQRNTFYVKRVRKASLNIILVFNLHCPIKIKNGFNVQVIVEKLL